MGKGFFFSGIIKFLELGVNRHNNKSASPPNPNLHTETSTPETPDNFTKNSELAWPQTPRKAEKYAKIIILLLLSIKLNNKINH